MLREIAARLGVQVDSAPLVGLMGALDAAKGALGSFGAALGAGALVHFVGEALETADALGDTSEKLGVSTDALQRFQYAVKLTGGDTESANRSIFILNKTLGEAAENGASPAAAALAQMGIALRDGHGAVKDISAILPELADKVAEAKDEATRTALATKFFGKSAVEIMPLLRRGAEGVKELSDEFDDLGGGITEGGIKAAGEAKDEIDRVHFATRGLTVQFAAAFAPALEKVIRFVTSFVAGLRYLGAHTSVFQHAMAAASIVLGAKLAPALLTTVRTMMALRTTLFGVSLPLWLVIAAVTGLYLIFDDLWTLMTGGDSLIGSVLEKFGGVEAKTKLVKALSDSWETLKGTWAAIKPILADLWKKIAEGSDTWIPALGQAFAAVVKSIVAGVSMFTGLIGAAAKAANGDWSGANAELGKAGDAVFGKNAQYWDPKTGQIVEKSVGGLFGTDEKAWAAEQAAANVPPPNVTNNNNVPVNVTLNVQTSGPLSPAETTKAVVTATNKSVSDAMQKAYNAVVTGDPNKSGGLAQVAYNPLPPSAYGP